MKAAMTSPLGLAIARLTAIAAIVAAITLPAGGRALSAVMLAAVLASYLAWAAGTYRHWSRKLSLAEKAIDLLADRLEEREAAAQQDQGRMHEVRATAAGIAAASQVIGTARPEARSALQDSLQAEASRLLRLLGGENAEVVAAVEVDKVIGPLVVAHRANGHVVWWRPSGLWARCRRDDLAEAVNELLGNAARHGTPADIRVAATTRPGRVEIAVTDTGPGITGDLRARLFARGARRPDSPGQGIGLHHARERLRIGGGDLRHQERPTDTCFVITLPTAPHHATDQTRLVLVGGPTRARPNRLPHRSGEEHQILANPSRSF